MTEILRIISSRRSVRTFDGRPLNGGDRDRLIRYAENADNPFGAKVRFVFLDAEKNGLCSSVITGEKEYVAGIVKKQPLADAAFGYSFEKLVLYAASLGVGTTWMAGTLNRGRFEKVSCLTDDEMMPCVSPLGYPAEKMSLREMTMRRGVGADRRLDAEKLFFDGVWGRPLAVPEGFAEAVQAVRLAPSAVNRQPWRVIKSGRAWHFYEKKGSGGFTSEKAGDLQKIDVGIALCHFNAALEYLGIQTEISVSDPSFDVPSGVEYIATVSL
ncbi:MAG: nitroreductase [Clostridia bacterium]|nr:nitroreductase [Clostridia bacterium]